MEELEIMCYACLRARYGQYPDYIIDPDTLKSEGWYITINPFQTTECDYCRDPWWFFWAREVLETANDQKL
ncbi:hypothetical protein ES703_65487 [subsurface metagenome]